MSMFAAFGRKFRTKAERIDIVVSGYFGYGNSGDDTVLDCIVLAIRGKYPEARIAVLCHDPKRFGDMHGIIGIGRYDLPRIIRALRGARLLISGGGSLLQNVTSSRSLFYYAGVIALGKACGTKVCVCANGIGPLKGRIGRWIAYKAVMMADRVSVRDPISKNILEEIGVPSQNVVIGADPAFMLAFDKRLDASIMSIIKNQLGIKKKREYFAVSLRAASCAGKHGEEICRACRDIYLNLGLVPVFISMQESEDEELCRRIADETCGEAITIPNVSAEFLCALLKDMKMVLSMRLHLMIYGAVVGTPAVGISVDPKLSAVGEMLGSSEIIEEEDVASDVILSAAKRAITADREKLLVTAKEQAKIAKEDLCAAAGMIEFNSREADVRSSLVEE